MTSREATDLALAAERLEVDQTVAALEAQAQTDAQTIADLRAQLAALTAPPPAPADPRPFMPYSNGAYFTTPVAGLKVDAARTAAFKTFMATHKDQRSTAYPLVNGVPGNAWGTAYALGSAGDPVWKLTGTIPTPVAQLRTSGFRAPEWLGSVLTGTSDSPFVVQDLVSGISVWAAKAALVGDHLISVGAAGLFEHSSNGLDSRNPASDSKVNYRSRGAIPDAMVIRRDLVDYAIANGGGLGHVLHMFLVETRTLDKFVSPMVGCESGKLGFGAEGERVAIRADVKLEERNLSPFGLVIARTLQSHGAYFGDNAGGASTLKAEQASASRNPWAGLDVSRTALNGITWDDFVVIAR